MLRQSAALAMTKGVLGWPFTGHSCCSSRKKQYRGEKQEIFQQPNAETNCACTKGLHCCGDNKSVTVCSRAADLEAD
jgi:hypothetical protein